MKLRILALLLFCLNGLAMDVVQSSKDEAKKTTLACMFALVQPRFESKYDQVMQLDVKKLGSEPIICTRRVSNTCYVYSFEEGEARRLLRELAITPEFAPLMPVLFKKWKNLEKSWIGNSMLLNAVDQNRMANIHELLKMGVDPNKPAYFFFQTDGAPKYVVEFALGGKTYNRQMKSPELIDLLFRNGLKIEPKLGNSMLLEAIENYLHLGDVHKPTIELLVEKGIDPFAQLGQKKISCNGESYAGSCAYDLAKWLANRDYNTKEDGAYNQKHRKKFKDLMKFFEG